MLYLWKTGNFIYHQSPLHLTKKGVKEYLQYVCLIWIAHFTPSHVLCCLHLIFFVFTSSPYCFRSFYFWPKKRFILIKPLLSLGFLLSHSLFHFQSQTSFFFKKIFFKDFLTNKFVSIHHDSADSQVNFALRLFERSGTRDKLLAAAGIQSGEFLLGIVADVCSETCKRDDYYRCLTNMQLSGIDRLFHG